MRPAPAIVVVVAAMALLAGVALGSGVITFADAPKPTLVAVQSAGPTAVPTLSAAQMDAARIQQMIEESEMCDCKR